MTISGIRCRTTYGFVRRLSIALHHGCWPSHNGRRICSAPFQYSGPPRFMITQFRRYTDSWIARGFFVLMAVSFVGWGISGDLFRLMGPPSWVAKIGGQTIEVPAFQTEFQRSMAQEARDLPQGQEASADVRRRIGQQTLERLIAQTALS